ncbi:hypothetical protein GCM10010840_15830 [Deinococcus aerolatus]|uniref:Uncharacterized protein n=1 Tax=Deinococcus aerolatus TaxID=522487 RepID=A0ABQ2G7Q4_9DEIO|nr:hypothetical protein GCM10010840_15830 [Deinococcus aerolatus]
MDIEMDQQETDRRQALGQLTLDGLNARTPDGDLDLWGAFSCWQRCWLVWPWPNLPRPAYSPSPS